MTTSTAITAVLALLLQMAMGKSIVDRLDECTYEGNMCSIDTHCIKDMIDSYMYIEGCLYMKHKPDKLVDTDEQLYFTPGQYVTDSQMPANWTYSVYLRDRSNSGHMELVEDCCDLPPNGECFMPATHDVNKQYIAVFPYNDEYDWRKYCMYKVENIAPIEDCVEGEEIFMPCYKYENGERITVYPFVPA